MSEQQNELQMIPKWEEIESSQNWKDANEMKRSQVRSAWLQDLLRLRDAGYVAGNDDDFVKMLKKHGWQSGQIAFAFNRHARETGAQGQGLKEDAAQMNLQREADPMFAPGTLSGSLSTNLELGIGRVAKVPQEALNALTFGQVEPLHDYVNNYRNYLDNERSLANVESAMIDGFKKGGVIGFGKAMGNSLLQETPNFLMQIGLTAVGGPMAGRAYMALSAIGDKFAEIQDDESLSPKQKMAIVATSTLFEVAWEELNTIPFAKKLTSQYGGAALREVFRSQGFKKAMLTIAKHIGKNANMEGWEEFFTEASQGISEKLIRDGNLSFDDIKEIVYNSTNAYLGGAAMGGIAEGAKIGVDIMGMGGNASRKAFAKHLGVTENNLPDKYNSASKRQAALDNYELHGEPITAEEPTVKDVRDALTDRLQWYAKLKDNDIRKQYDASAQEWQQKLNDLVDMPDNDIVQLPNRERDLTQEREAEKKEREVLGKGMRNLLGRMRMPGDKANVPAQETTTTEQPIESPVSEETKPTEQEQPEPPKVTQEPTVQADDTDKAKQENERRRQEAAQLEEENRQREDYIAERMKHGEMHEAQHSDGTAAGNFREIIVDISPNKRNILTSSDKGHEVKGVTMQNREGGVERENKIAQIKKSPIWQKFLDWAETHVGSPIVGKDGRVESGNTRMDALRQLYQEGKADEYKFMVAKRAAELKTSIEGMEMPAIVRVRETEMDAKGRNDFIRRANSNNELRGMSDANRAQDDAAAFADNQDELLSLYHPPADQNQLVSANDMTFLNRFRELVGADPNDVDENSHYTERFFNRIRNTFLGALFNKLPNGRDLVKSFANTDKMKTVLNGLMPSIPRLLKQGTTNPNYDITETLGKALMNLRRYKLEQENGSKLTPEDFARQGLMLNEDGSMMTAEQAAAYRMDDSTKEMFLNLANIRSMKEMRQLMNQYMNAVSEAAGINDMDNGKHQMSLFNEQPRTREEIIKGMKDFVKKRQNEAEGRRLRKGGKRNAYAVAYDKEAQAASPLIEGARVATTAELRKAGLEGGTKKVTVEENTIEKVNRLVDRAKTLFPGFKFVVHETQEEASQFVNIPEGKIVNAWNDHGTIHVVAENIAKAKDPYQILTGHEIVGHSGLKMVISKTRWNTAMEGIFRDHGDEIQKAVADYGFDYATEDGRVAAAEEWLATIARMGTKPAWWKSLISKIRDMLRMAGMGRLKWTDADIENLIAEGTQAARTSADAEAQMREMAGNEPKFSIRKENPPKKTGIGYKVFYQKDGKLYPPMIANPGGEDTPVGVWLNADAAPIVGESKTGRAKVKQGGKGTQGGSGTLAYRPGWHLGEIPYALQFNRGEKVDNPVGMKNEKGELIKVGRYFPKNFVWAEVEYAADEDYQQEAESYGYDEKGKFRHSFAGLPKIPTDGYYRYRTNPNPATDPWIITGAMKVNRVLTKAEVDEIVKKAGRTPQEVEPDGKAKNSDKKFSLEQIAPLPAKQEEAEERILDAVSTHPVEDLKALRLPLMIDLANALGSSVKSTDRLPPGVLGQFRHDGPAILLLRKLAAGKELGDAVVTNDPDAQAEQQLAYWEKLGVPRDEVEVIIRPIEGSDESVVKLIWKDRTLSLVRKVAAHEVGHLVDFTSGSTTKHGNILGTVAGTLHKYLKHVIGEDSDSPIDWSAWEKRKRELHKQAEKMAGTKPTEETALKEWRKTVKDNYRSLYNMECEQNNWFQKAVIRDELKDLTEWWSGDITDPEYRLRPTELYAEAMSVLFNTPEQLAKRAPETWRMIQNYLAEKPLFASEWQRMMEIMSSDEAYGEELLNMQEQGFDMGEAKKGTTAAEPTWKDRIKNIGKDALRSVQDIFYDINEAAADLRKRGVMGWNESPDAAISEARHSSIRDAYMKAASILEQPLLDAGLTLKDVGLYLMDMRIKDDITTKNNETILNPFGMNSMDDVDNALKALKRRLGEEKWQALEDWHKKFWKLRQNTILKMAEDSGAYSRELVEHMLANEWYSYRMVTTQLLNDDGHEKLHGSGARIYGLKGTLSPLANPLGWTYENDLRLMNGLLWNNARMKTGEMMKHYFASLVDVPKIKGRDMKGNFIYSDPAEGMARVTYLKDGKLERVDIPEAWAAGFAKGGANESLKTLSFLTNIWRLAYTTYSRTFGAQNPIRDFVGTFQNMTYMGDKSSWKEWSRYWWKGMKEAFGEQFGNDRWFRWIFGDSYVNGSAIAQEMERLNMFQSEAHGYGDAQTQHDRLLQRYGIIPMEIRGWEKYVPEKAKRLVQLIDSFVMPIKDFVGSVINAEEHGVKIGGYLMMNAKMPNMSMEEKRWHVHRHIGSPDFTVKGRFTPLTNTILIFSNASIQGWKATAESYKTNPKAYASNWMYSVALPKFIQWSLASGVMLAAAKAVGMDDDNPLCKMLDWFKRMYGKISQYNRANYMCLPIAETTGGKCVFVRIPMAENSKPGAMVFQAMLESLYNGIPNSKSAAEKTGDAVASALPNWNPMLMFGWDAGWLAAGHNVRDFHTGRPAVDQDMWNAGGIYRAWGSAKYLWHEYVPETGFRFDTRNNTWLYDLIANNLGFGALVKLSDYGEKEQERAVKEIRRNEKARAKMKMPGAAK